MTIKFSSVKVHNPIKPNSKIWKESATEWCVKINNIEFSYFTGSAITESPTYDDVMYSLLFDYDAAQMNYEEFLCTYGYDDNKESKQIYNECKKTVKKINKLGIDLDTERERLQDCSEVLRICKSLLRNRKNMYFDLDYSNPFFDIFPEIENEMFFDTNL